MSRALAIFTSVLVLSETAFADETEKAGGLPQMDPTWFVSQLFWLVVIFATLYIIFARNVLPNLAATLESRREHIQSDLDTAEELKQEAEGVFEDYELILQESRDKAAQLYADIDADIREKSAAEYAEFQDRLTNETKTAEEKITKAKQKAMAEMNDIVAEVAKDAAEKVVGISTDMNKAQDIVKDLAKKPKAA